MLRSNLVHQKMLETTKQRSAIISRVDLRERVYAFFITSAAVFVVGCLIWPLSVTGFRSVVKINVLPGAELESSAQLEQLLGYIVKNETEDQRLRSIVDEIAAAGELDSDQTRNHDYQAIKNSIKFGVDQKEQEYQLSVVYDGEGGQDERTLVKLLSVRVANRLAIQANPTRGGVGPLKNLEQANWIVDQIESDLEFVKSGLNQLAANSPMDGSRRQGTGSQFLKASSTKIVGSEFAGLEQAVDSIDIQSLRSVLLNVKRHIAGQSPNGDPGVELSGSNPQMLVTSLTPIKTIPIRGVPSLGILLALGAFAGLVGTVISGHFQPFALRGFSGVETIGKTLGVPVVAAIASDRLPATAEIGQGNNGIGWANRVVKASGLILFGIFVIVAGFILINPEVRQAFFENPFFGCAKIIRLFVGY